MCTFPQFSQRFYENLCEVLATPDFSLDRLPSWTGLQNACKALPLDRICTFFDGCIAKRDMVDVVMEGLHERDLEQPDPERPLPTLSDDCPRFSSADGDLIRQQPYTNPVTKFQVGDVEFEAQCDVQLLVDGEWLPRRVLGVTMAVDGSLTLELQLYRHLEEMNELAWVYPLPRQPDQALPLRKVEAIVALSVVGGHDSVPELGQYLCRSAVDSSGSVEPYIWTPPTVFVPNEHAQLPSRKVALEGFEDGFPTSGKTRYAVLPHHHSLKAYLLRVLNHAPGTERDTRHIKGYMFSTPGWSSECAALQNQDFLRLRDGFLSPSLAVQGALVAYYADDAEKTFTRTTPGRFPFDSSFAVRASDSGNPLLDFSASPRYEAAVDALQHHAYYDSEALPSELYKRQKSTSVSAAPNPMKGRRTRC